MDKVFIWTSRDAAFLLKISRERLIGLINPFEVDFQVVDGVWAFSDKSLKQFAKYGQFKLPVHMKSGEAAKMLGISIKELVELWGEDIIPGLPIFGDCVFLKEDLDCYMLDQKRKDISTKKRMKEAGLQ